MAAEFLGLEVGTWSDVSSNLMALAALIISWRGGRKPRARLEVEDGPGGKLNVHNLTSRPVTVIAYGQVLNDGQLGTYFKDQYYEAHGQLIHIRFPREIPAESSFSLPGKSASNPFVPQQISEAQGWFVQISETSWFNRKGRIFTTLPWHRWLALRVRANLPWRKRKAANDGK